MHYLQVLADAAAGLLLFLALRLWHVGRPAAFVAAIAFSFYPVHDETHYWLSSLPMNIMSTVFVLALVCLSALLLRTLSATGRNAAKLLLLLVAYFLVFLCSMFTYDQTVPVVMVIVTLVAATIFYRYPNLRIFAAGSWLVCFAVFVALAIWKVRVPGGGAGFFQPDNRARPAKSSDQHQHMVLAVQLARDFSSFPWRHSRRAGDGGCRYGCYGCRDVVFPEAGQLAGCQQAGQQIC